MKDNASIKKNRRRIIYFISGILGSILVLILILEVFAKQLLFNLRDWIDNGVNHIEFSISGPNPPQHLVNQAQLRNPEALYQLSLYWYNYAFQYNQARLLYRDSLEQAAHAGSIMGMLSWGLYNSKNDWGDEKHELAEYWYKRAYRACHKLAHEGNAEAQYILGYIYSQGMGIPKQKEKALYWWRCSAQQNNLQSINALKNNKITNPDFSM